MSDVSLSFTAAPGLEPHMQESISNVWMEQYQQRTNPIESLFTTDPMFAGYKSRLYNFIDEIDEATAVQDITTRAAQGGATIAVDMTGKQRRMTGKIYDLAVRFSQWDKELLGEMENPKNPTWREMQNAANRKNLAYCLGQLTADVTICAEDGDVDGTATFASESVTVPVDYKRTGGRDGTGEACPMTVDKLNYIRRTFVENRVCGQDVTGAEDKMPVMICTSDDIDNLASDKRVSSAEYGGRKIDVLYSGRLTEWGGMRFLLLPKSILTDTNGVRSIYAWLPEAFMFYSGNPFIRIAELPTHKHKIQLYQGWRIACMRLRGKGIIKCNVLA